MADESVEQKQATFWTRCERAATARMTIAPQSGWPVGVHVNVCAQHAYSLGHAFGERHTTMWNAREEDARCDAEDRSGA